MQSTKKKLYNLPSGKTCLIFRYDVVSLITDALSNCDVIAAGSGNSFASSRNSAFSFSLLDLAAFLLFSFMAPLAPANESEKKFIKIKKIYIFFKLKFDTDCDMSYGEFLCKSCVFSEHLPFFEKKNKNVRLRWGFKDKLERPDIFGCRGFQKYWEVVHRWHALITNGGNFYKGMILKLVIKQVPIVKAS